MTNVSRSETDILGCRIKYDPAQDELGIAREVMDLVKAETEGLKKSRPMLNDTHVAVLVALKFATELKKIEQEYKHTVLRLETSLEQTLGQFEGH